MERKLIIKALTSLLLFIFMWSPGATDRRKRLGIGLSNQLINDIPALSFKLQRSRSFSIGGLLGYDSSDNNGGFGAGLKFYRNFFEEPQLNFYGALTAALIQQDRGVIEESGFQIDLTLGSEFSFAGLQSLAFSFEFGVSAHKLEDFTVQTVGNSFLVLSAHFYL